MVVVTPGSPRRIFFDAEMGNALLLALTALTDDQAVRVVVVTGVRAYQPSAPRVYQPAVLPLRRQASESHHLGEVAGVET